jgi:hypothetical protein
MSFIVHGEPPVFQETRGRVGCGLRRVRREVEGLKHYTILVLIVTTISCLYRYPRFSPRYCLQP